MITLMCVCFFFIVSLFLLRVMIRRKEKKIVTLLYCRIDNRPYSCYDLSILLYTAYIYKQYVNEGPLLRLNQHHW